MVEAYDDENVTKIVCDQLEYNWIQTVDNEEKDNFCGPQFVSSVLFSVAKRL